MDETEVAVGSAALGEEPSSPRTTMQGEWFQVAANDPGVKTVADRKDLEVHKEKMPVLKVLSRLRFIHPENIRLYR